MSNPSPKSLNRAPKPARDDFQLADASPERLARLCGQLNVHLKQIEKRLDVRVRHRGDSFRLEGPAAAVRTARAVIERLHAETATGELLPEYVHLCLQEAGAFANAPDADDSDASREAGSLRTPKLLVRPRGPNQQLYLRNIGRHDINFGIGPAGTGKTYLAVAAAVNALSAGRVQRILLVRPAVEAGEKLGFLPGDLAQKVDPYLRPLYDSLYEMIGFDQTDRMMERNLIEVAPLAFMRGRTLNNAFILMDESQNTTVEQMKMFLTRIGFGSSAVITGDITQTDLPHTTRSGLVHATEVLADVPDIGFTRFHTSDVVRHALVQRIVEAYDRERER